tara:strand:- start:366 stop:1019 length:654 start_codon:yes stop_codon:yes gene_type:complete
MAVKKIFWGDPYLKEIEAKVTSVSGGVVTLDKTIFYAFTGGQSSDSGTIGGCKVIEAKKFWNEILYTLKDHNLNVGDNVVLNIDWEKRYKIMKLHFAAEIILELVYQNFNRPEKIGANITHEKARLDFRWDGNISEAFELLIKEAKELILLDFPIKSDFSDTEKEIRYWQIENFAKVACGGTHIKRTGEIGEIMLKRKSLGSCKERIEIYLCPTPLK